MKHIALFAGIGGDTLAAQWAGFETVLFVENDKYCQQVLAKHWPGVPIKDDIRRFDGKEYRGTITLITGGHPCQPVSQAGERRGKEDDRWLWPEMFRVIREIRPAWVVPENVAGLLRMGLNDCISDLEGAGYEVQTFIIPACAVNAPHRRDRVFIVAHDESSGLGQVLDTIPVELLSEDRSPQESQSNSGADADFPAEGLEGADPEGAAQAGGRPLQYPGRDWWAVEPGVGRVVHGVPSRMDRLKGLGNAIVPLQIYPILKAIAEVEK